MTRFQSKLKTTAVAFSFIIGIAVFSGITAQAQYPYGRDRRDGRYESYQIARERGFQDGLNTGSDDAIKRQSFDPERSHYYRNATDGYNSSFGNKNGYKDAFREGFLRGYREGFQRNRGGYERRDRRYPY